MYPSNGTDPDLGALLNWDPRNEDDIIYVVDQVTADSYRVTACETNAALNCGGTAKILHQGTFSQ